MILPNSDANVIKSFRNIPRVKTIRADSFECRRFTDLSVYSLSKRVLGNDGKDIFITYGNFNFEKEEQKTSKERRKSSDHSTSIVPEVKKADAVQMPMEASVKKDTGGRRKICCECFCTGQSPRVLHSTSTSYF